MTAPDRLVVDASAVADGVLRPDGVGDVVRTVLATSQCHAPHLIDAQRLDHAHRLVDVRHEMTGPLTETAWRLRHEITFCDAV